MLPSTSMVSGPRKPPDGWVRVHTTSPGFSAAAAALWHSPATHTASVTHRAQGMVHVAISGSGRVWQAPAMQTWAPAHVAGPHETPSVTSEYAQPVSRSQRP